MTTDFATSLQDLLIDFLKPLDEAARDSSAFIEWLASLGHTTAISKHPTLLQIAQHAQSVIAKLAAFDSQTLQSTDGLISILSCGRETGAILQELRDFANDPVRSQFAQGLAEDVMSLLLASLLRRRYPTAFRIASLLTLIEARETAAMDPPIVANGTTMRYARVVDRFRFSALSDLVHQPGATLKGFYFPNDLLQGADAWLGAQRLFPNLAFLADAISLAWRADYRSTLPASPTPEPDPNEPIPDGESHPDPEGPPMADDAGETDVAALPAPLPVVPDEYYATSFPRFYLAIAGDDASNAIALEILASSLRHPGGVAGLILALTGDFNRTEMHDSWKLTFSSSGEIPALSVERDGLARVADDHPLANGTAKLLIERIRDTGSTGPAFIFGGARSTRLEIGNLKLGADLAFDPTTWTAAIGLNADSGALVLMPADGDGFLASVLPANGTRAEFNLGLAWSNTSGFTLSGGAGLDVKLPIGRSIGGLTLSSIDVRMQVQDAMLLAAVAVSMSVTIGPVQASIDRIGLDTSLSVPQDGGNLGVADLDFAFKPPNGVGLSIDTQGVLTGGGFLFHDAAQHLYAGVMQLSLHDELTFTAYGLIATTMPDGQRGYSLLIFITAEGFQPIPLGFGFVLQRIGGMVGIHRTFDQDVIKSGLKSDTLATLLLPHDPVTNAAALLQALASAFPAKQGSYLLGLVAQITWFTPTLVQLDLALILELGAHTRLLALARVSALLPSPDDDLIRLKLDALGVLDFDAETFTADAVLVDSRLAHQFPITGSAALRSRWSGGAGTNFVLAVGGLNPRFAPPDGFPTLERVAIALCSGDNPRLVCDAYFAVTANTIQFGSQTSLYAEAGGCSVTGDLGFDTLVTLMPPHFIADFHAAVQLQYESFNLFKVTLDGTLEGPLPLRLSAKATIDILFFSCSFHFNFTLVDGDAAQTGLPAVALAPELTKALSDPTNWSTRRAPRLAQGVALRSLPPSAMLVLDPLGQLVVQQQVVPLNTSRDVDMYDGAPVIAPRRFQVQATLNGQAGTPVTAAFAPARYFVMSDDEKLVAPSFETMDAGLVVGDGAVVFDAAAIVPAPLEYEEITLNPTPLPTPAALLRYTMPVAALQTQRSSGAAALAPIRRVGYARFRNTAVTPAATVVAFQWHIVAMRDGARADVDPTITTWSEYRSALDTLNRGGARWLMVPAHELNA